MKKIIEDAMNDPAKDWEDPEPTVAEPALKSGYKYNFEKTPMEYRKTWHLPDSALKHMHKEVCGNGCTKKRQFVIGHKQRSAIWIWMCMKHDTILGYHIMGKSEGIRDALFPLYRFRKTAPKAIFVDFACGCEEAALNWLPEFFKDTQFFHDVFHGYTHICAERFSATRLEEFVGLNSSVMEQVR